MIQARFGNIRVISPELFNVLASRGRLGVQKVIGRNVGTLQLYQKSPDILFIERILPIHRYRKVEQLAQLFPHLAIEDTYNA